MEYRKRRAHLAQVALQYRIGQDIPLTEYSTEEVETWSVVWDKMEHLLEKVSESERERNIDGKKQGLNDCNRLLMYMLNCSLS